MGEGEANPEWDEIAENTGLDHEQVIMVVMMVQMMVMMVKQGLVNIITWNIQMHNRLKF